MGLKTTCDCALNGMVFMFMFLLLLDRMNACQSCALLQRASAYSTALQRYLMVTMLSKKVVISE